MLFAGAGGLAAQLFDDIESMNLKDIAFWSETESANTFITEKYQVLKTDQEVAHYFNTMTKKFVICMGERAHRKTMMVKFLELGGEPGTFVSPFGNHSKYIREIGAGTIILRDVDIEPDVSIGEGCLINKQSNFGHGCKVGNYCDIGPMVTVSAESSVGENCMIGMGSIIIPRVKIGNGVIISAGSVVTKNLPDHAVVSGVPAKLRFKRN